jgi:MYXO-CTERM domain-containing protein
MTTVYVSRPDLVVGNSTDPDGDMLSYTFEVHTMGDFSPASFVAMGRVFEGSEGQTTWTLTSDLMDGQRYFWRVYANDGTSDSPMADTFFDVSIVPTADTDPDASTDVVTDTIWIPPATDDGTCGCSTLPGRPGGLALILVGLALAALLARRRR